MLFEMECNRDEALRAREIAEKKLAVQDYASASKFAYKAQQLYPGLENLGQMLAVIEVHIAAQIKLNGTELDWYKILQVETTADEVSIKKQYKKLALLLHPDKNKFAGAEAAFKLIGEASQILSDKTKRNLHDIKRRGVSNRAVQNVNSNQNAQMNFSNGQYRGMASQPVNVTTGPYPRMPSVPQLSTFWTACPSCQMRYQYLRTYENQNLLCPNCRLSFIAKDLNSMQGNGASATYSWTPHFGPQQQQDFSGSFFRPGFNSFNGFPSGAKVKAFPSDPGYSSGTFATTVPPAGAKTTEEYIQQTYEKAKQEREKAEAEREQRRKRKEELQRIHEKGKEETEAEREEKRKKREEEQREKEIKRLEREQIRKAKNDERTRGAMERLMTKKKEQAEKVAHREKKRRLKKHTSEDSSNGDDTDEDETLEDMLSVDQVMMNNTGSLRRSSRRRRNVNYTVESDDDDDLEDFPASKKARVEADEKKLDNDPLCGGASERGVKNTGMMSETKAPDGPKDITKKLADFAKNAIREKLNLQGVKSGGKGEHGTTPIIEQEEIEEKLRESVAGSNEEKMESVEGRNESKGKENAFEGKESVTENIDELEEPEPDSYTVPDADFHNFDVDREEKDVKPGQIWALYDELDGMPRYHIRVKNVSYQNQFKATVTWLDLRNPSPDQIKLQEADFTCACGDFKMLNSMVMDSVNMFSHIVKWEKGPKGSIRIYPHKGDVWGLHRDWEPGQMIINIDYSPFKYNMVEVLTDYNEETGCIVKPLVKVNGFKTLFQQSEKPSLEIHPEELLRFSHRVPAYKLTGDEAPGVPRGCWELDPASMPLDLIFPGRV